MKVGIVGHGVVGSAHKRWMAQIAEHLVVIYDKFQPEYNSGSTRLLWQLYHYTGVCRTAEEI